MRLVVDTNRIFAALIKDSATRKIIENLKADFITIGFSKKEILKHKKLILQKSGLTVDELEYLLGKVMDKMIVLDDELIKKRFPKAEKIMDNIDKNDTPFVAAALAADAAIWSDDKHFERQKVIKLYKTNDLIKQMKN